jgi:hypothetical protein
MQVYFPCLDALALRRLRKETAVVQTEPAEKANKEEKRKLTEKVMHSIRGPMSMGAKIQVHEAENLTQNSI